MSLTYHSRHAARFMCSQIGALERGLLLLFTYCFKEEANDFKTSPWNNGSFKNVSNPSVTATVQVGAGTHSGGGHWFPSAAIVRSSLLPVLVMGHASPAPPAGRRGPDKLTHAHPPPALPLATAQRSTARGGHTHLGAHPPPPPLKITNTSLFSKP